jgi:hypothetical protein
MNICHPIKSARDDIKAPIERALIIAITAMGIALLALFVALKEWLIHARKKANAY